MIRGVMSITEETTLSTSNVKCGLIPSGYRPRANILTIQQATAGYHWLLSIYSNGNMYIARYSNGSEYKTTQANSSTSVGTWFPFTVTYIL